MAELKSKRKCICSRECDQSASDTRLANIDYYVSKNLVEKMKEKN